MPITTATKRTAENPYCSKKQIVNKYMETTKERYEAPLCEVLQMDAVQVICTSGIHEGFEDGETVEW